MRFFLEAVSVSIFFRTPLKHVLLLRDCNIYSNIFCLWNGMPLKANTATQYAVCFRHVDFLSQNAVSNAQICRIPLQRPAFLQEVVGALEHFFSVHHIWTFIIPADFHIFQRGLSTTNQIHY